MFFHRKRCSHIKTSNLFSKTKITKLIGIIRNLMKTANQLNFDIPSLLSDESYFDLTGLTKAKFADLCTEVPNLKQSNVRSVCTTVAIFLTKMRIGISNKPLSNIFDPQNLGFGHVRITILSRVIR